MVAPTGFVRILIVGARIARPFFCSHRTKILCVILSEGRHTVPTESKFL